MNVVIMGSGRIGGTLANSLSAEGHAVSIIDITSSSFDRYLAADFRGQTILGDGIDEDVLREAGIERADAFVACAHGDNHNLMASQIAKVAFGVKRVVCRCNDAVRAEIFRDVGLVTVSPSRLAADGLRAALLDDDRHNHDVAASIAQLLVK
jgi:trk system potassium uptake protein TrkA